MKQFTLLVALFAAFAAHAQTQKGNSFVSGSASFSHQVSGFLKEQKTRIFVPEFALTGILCATTWPSKYKQAYCGQHLAVI